MEVTIYRIMDRLMQNPTLKNIQMGTVASWVKDMISINDLPPTLEYPKFAYVQIEDYKGVVPPEFYKVRKVFLCPDDFDPHPAVWGDGALNKTLSESLIREKEKSEYGEYDIRNGVVYVDVASIDKVELMGSAYKVDDLGFPILPYDGSLLQACVNYVKYQYYTMMAESQVMPKHFAQDAHKEYMWYIGQYTSKVDMPDEDEAVAIANHWQKFVQTRNLNMRGESLPQYIKGPSNYRYFR